MSGENPGLPGGMVDELDEDEKKLFEGESIEDVKIPDLDEETGEPILDEDDGEEVVKKTDDDTSDNEAPKKETKEDDEDEDGEETVEVENRGRFVRHGALHAEREKRKRIENALKEREKHLSDLQQKFARADERLQLLYRAAQGEERPGKQPHQVDGDKPEVGEKPDKYKNPFEYMDWMEQRLEQAFKIQNESVQERQEREQYEEAYDNARNFFMQDAQAFMNQEDPETGEKPYQDLMYAYAHLINSRDAELQMMGYSNPKARAEIVKQEEFAIVQQAAQQRQSPSAMIYQLAKQRGYQFNPEWVQKQESSDAAEAEAKAEAEKGKTLSPAERIKQINKAKESNRSLSEASGAQGKPQWSSEYLADMPEEEFWAVFDKMSDKQKKMYFGG